MRPYRTMQRTYTGNDPQLMEPAGEPTAHQWDAARIELGPWASNAQIERRALQLLDDELRDNDRMSEDDVSVDELEDWT
jgi:hypothetical protein